ncbi:MAG TPA: hypothetical protein VKP30_33415 [Polyangiaceae bacterium]|nr:hypothetical protein [Polyangiaceae bacterium]
MTRLLVIGALATCLLPQPSVAYAASPPPGVATEEARQAAQKMFEAGDGLYESGRYEDAIAAFKNSHHLVASPNSRLMLARSLREAGHYAQACVEFRGTIQDAEATSSRYPEALASARSELAALERSLGHLELDAKLGEQIRELTINGKTVEPLGARIPVPAGTLHVELRLKDGSRHSNTIDLAQGEHKPLKRLEFETQSLTQAEAPPAGTTREPTTPAVRNGGVRTAAWISAGIGAAGLTVFGAFGVLNWKAFQDLQSSCPADRCSTASADKIDAGRRYQLVANLGLGVAVLGTAAATTLFVLSMRKQAESPAVALSLAPTGLQLDGRF